MRASCAARSRATLVIRTRDVSTRQPATTAGLRAVGALPVLWLAPAIAAAAAVPAAPPALVGFDQRINDAVSPVSNCIAGIIFRSAPIGGTAFPLVVGWLILTAIVFTLYFGFVQFRKFGHAISRVKSDYSDPNDAGEVSHFQALATALSGTVGLGNIAGVAVAVSLGGPDATFWMILAGLLGMASKSTECTPGVKVRNEYPDGRVSGRSLR